MSRRFLVSILALFFLAAAPAQGSASTSSTSGDGRSPDAITARSAVLAKGLSRDADFPQLPDKCFPGNSGAPKAQACFVNDFDGARPTVLIWGDSHAWEYLDALRGAVKGRDVNLVSFVSGGCPPVKLPPAPDGTRYPRCERNNYMALRYIRKAVNRHRTLKVILSANWSGYHRVYRAVYVNHTEPESDYEPYALNSVRLEHDHTTSLFDELGRLRVPTDVVGQSGVYPEGHKSPCKAGMDPYQCDLRRYRVLPEEDETRDWLESEAARLSGSPRYIDTSSVYCNAFVCHGLVDKVHTFYDHLHLGDKLTRSTMVKYFVPSVKDVS